jgi:hypothetical protein
LGQIGVKPLLAGLALLLCASAAPHSQPQPQPPVWTIADSDTKITLFATVHALPAGLDWLSPAAAERLQAADALILETVIPEDRTALARTVARLGTSQTLPPLAERLPPETLKALSAAANSLGVPLASFETMHPWLIAISIGEAMLSGLGISSANGVEPALMMRTRAPIQGLETAEEQLGFFAALSLADQHAMLESTLAEQDTAKSDIARLITFWQQGKVDAIAAEFAGEAAATPALREALLAARNRRWADQLKARMAKPGKVFVAVGAAHFGGKDGLLAELAARGFKPVQNPAPKLAFSPTLP